MNGMINLVGKKGLIVGIANQDSLAYGIARKVAGAGAALAITHLNAKAEPFVKPLSEALKADLFMPCDVLVEGQLEAVFARIAEKWGSLDFVVHSIAYAPLADLHGRVVDCSLEGFKHAMDVSCHSFARMAKLAEPLMKNGGALVNLSYHGAEKVIPNYNMMGPVKAALECLTRYIAHELADKRIRAVSISPGPMRTRASSGIKDFNSLVDMACRKVPFYEEIGQDDIGDLAAFLVSDAARFLNGYTYYVDNGLSQIGG